MELQQILKEIKKLIPEEYIIEKRDHYRLPTICHNIDHQNTSNKLYLYKNEDTTPLFHCYTECNETFNIYQLLQKYHALRGENLTYRDAFKKCHGIEYERSPDLDIREVKYETKFKNPLSVMLPEYSEHPLDMFSLDETHPWRLEGMEISMLEDFDIGYSKSREQVSIPHRDWRGRLVGIRIRNLDPFKAKSYKYMPLYVNNTFYSHPLSLNMYGIFENQTAIKQAKQVYIYEAEKSVFFHSLLNDNDLALAVCGKNISKWHSDMLINFLNVNQVIVGFDKEYTDYSSAFDYVKRIEKQTTYLRNFAKVGVLIDDDNVLRQSQAPVDGTKTQFDKLNIWWLD